MSEELLAGAAPPPDAWPELVLLDTPDLPRLDLKHLPSWAGDFARALADFTETPPELAAGMVLVSCSTAVARKAQVLIRPGYFEPCNLWFVVALGSGNRKSAVQGAATAPLRAWERAKAESMRPEINRVTSQRKTMEAQIKHLRAESVKNKSATKREELAQEAADLEEKLPEIPKPPQLWTSDSTPERLGTLLEENGERLAWLSSEGGIFDLLQGRYTNGVLNLDLILKSHSGDTERVDRGSRPPLYLHNPLLSIGLSPQPDVLRGLASKPGFRGRGLLARFGYLLPPSPLGYRGNNAPLIPETVSAAYENGLRAMLDWELDRDEEGNARPRLLRLDSGASEKLAGFARSIELRMRPGGELDQVQDWAGKAPGTTARLAATLHCIQHADDQPWLLRITAETMSAAVSIMSVVSRHSLAAMDLMGADATIAGAREVWFWIKRGKRTGFKARDAFNALRGRFPQMAKLMQAFEALEERGYVKLIGVKKEGAGRPESPLVIVRSEFVEKWQ